jgi:glycine dehydrogenase subunit 1
MSLLGKSGLRTLAEVNTLRAHDVFAQLQKATKLEAAFSAPFFNEFVLRAPDVRRLFVQCADHKIVPGILLNDDYPELANSFLICVTEMNQREEIERLVRTVSQ